MQGQPSSARWLASLFLDEKNAAPWRRPGGLGRLSVLMNSSSKSMGFQRGCAYATQRSRPACTGRHGPAPGKPRSEIPARYCRSTVLIERKARSTCERLLVGRHRGIGGRVASWSDWCGSPYKPSSAVSALMPSCLPCQLSLCR